MHDFKKKYFINFLSDIMFYYCRWFIKIMYSVDIFSYFCKRKNDMI